MLTSNIQSLAVDVPKLLFKQAIQPVRLSMRQELPHPSTQLELANLVNSSLRHGIRAGFTHRFINLLFVTVGDRVFCRRYSFNEPSWHSAFRGNPSGQIKLDKTIVNISACIPQDLEDIIPAVDQAYAAKLKQLGARFLLQNAVALRSQRSTIELTLANNEITRKDGDKERMAEVNVFGSKGWSPERVGSLKGKTYVITGANAGAGYEASKILLSKGASVVMLNRNIEKSKIAIDTLTSEIGRSIDVRFIQMDLANLASVRSAAAKVNAEVPYIDAIICNAAIAQVAKQQITIDGFESQLGTNHYGHFLFTRLVFNRIIESKGRIVVVGSNGHKMGLKRIQFDDMNFDKNYNGHVTYCHSKFAQMMFAYELERRVKQAGLPISVHVCHPGMAKTTLAQEESAGFTKLLLKIAAPFAQSAERGSWPEVLCATEQNLKEAAYYGPTKRGEMMGPVGECTLEGNVLDPEAANQLWAVSELATGVKWVV